MNKNLRDAVTKVVRDFPRSNPPDAEDVTIRVDALGRSATCKGIPMSANTEDELAEALSELGVPDDEIASEIESLTSWEE